MPLAWRREYVGVFRLKSRKKKLKVYFVDNEHYFCRGRVYGEPDDGERFAFSARRRWRRWSLSAFSPT